VSARVLLSGVRHCITERPAHTGVHSRTHPLLSRSVARVLLVAASLSHCLLLLLLLDLPRLVVSSSLSSQPNQTIKSAHHHQPRTIHKKRKSIITYLASRALSRSLRLDSSRTHPQERHDTSPFTAKERAREREHIYPFQSSASSLSDRSETLDARPNTNTRPHDLTHKHKERTKERKRERERERKRERERASTSTLATTTSLPFTCAHTHTHTLTKRERERERGYSEKTAKSIGYAGSPSMKSWPSSSASGLMRRWPAA